MQEGDRGESDRREGGRDKGTGDERSRCNKRKDEWSKSKSNFIRNAACTRTNISIVINCQHVALHGCHLAKSRLPVTPSTLKNNHHYYRYTIHVCSITTQYKRRIIKVKLHILLDITKTVLIQ